MPTYAPASATVTYTPAILATLNEYLNETLRKVTARRADQVGVFIVGIRDPNNAAVISQRTVQGQWRIGVHDLASAEPGLQAWLSLQSTDFAALQSQLQAEATEDHQSIRNAITTLRTPSRRDSKLLSVCMVFSVGCVLLATVDVQDRAAQVAAHGG